MSTTSSAIKNSGYKSLLSEKEYLKLVLAKLITRFGDSIDTIAYSWMVYKLTGSALLVTSIFAVNAVPNIIFCMISGVVSNYFKKKNVLLVCDFGRGAVAFITAILFMTGNLSVWMLYIFTFINSTFESFRGPASTVLYSYVVPIDKITYANSLDSTLTKTVELVGFGIAGILIAVIGIGGVILVDAFTFFICGSIIGTIKIANEIIKKEKLTINQYFIDLKEGFSYLKTNHFMLHITLFANVFNMFFIPVYSLQSIYVGEVLHGETYVLSIFGTSMVLGTLFGGILAPKIKEKISGKTLFIISGVLLSLAYVGLSVIHYIPEPMVKFSTLAALVFVLGVSLPLMNMLVTVAVMTKTDKEYLSRVAAIMNTLGLLGTPVGALIAGSISSFISIPRLYMICGVVVLCLSLLQIGSKNLREL